MARVKRISGDPDESGATAVGDKKGGGCLKFVIIAIIGLLLFGACVAALSGDDDPSAGGPSATSPTAAEEATEEEATEEEATEEEATEEETTEEETTEEETTEEETTQAEEQAIEVSAQEMIETLEGNALKAKNTYQDKRVTVSGFVGGIDASGNYFALDPEPDAFILTGIQVQTSEEFLDQMANFSEGQEVTVTGTVTDVGEILGYSIEAESIEE